MSGAIVYLAGVSWDAVRGTDRHLVERLAQARQVVWVDPPLSLAHLVRGRGAGAARPAPVSTPAPGVVRVSVVVPPWPLRPAMVVLTERLVRAAVHRVLDRLRLRTVAVVNASPYLSFDVVAPARRRVGLYYATDDFVAAAPLWGVRPAGIAAAERRRMREADVLAAVSPLILARWGETGRPAHLLPNGCDALAYARTPGTPAELAGLARADRPVAGLVGQISARIDLGLLEAVAERSLTLLLVGPVLPDADQERVRALTARPAVMHVGPQPFDALPGYLAAMDVGLTPYRDTAFNRASFPLKTLEYLAAGLPVVSTPLPAVAALGTGLVATAAAAEDFADLAESAARTGRDPGAVEARRRFAVRHDWSVRARELVALLEGPGGMDVDEEGGPGGGTVDAALGGT